METNAILAMVLIQGTVTSFAVWIYYKILTTPSDSKKDGHPKD